MDLIITLFIFLGGSYFLYRYGSKIFTKKYTDKSEVTQKLNALQLELSQEKLIFKIVPSQVMYSKTFGIYLKYVSFMVAIGVLSLLLDILFHGTKSIYQHENSFQEYTFAYVVAIFVFFGGVIGSIAWKYYFFTYGLVNKIQNMNVISDLISSYVKKISKYYFYISAISFLFGTIFFHSGYKSYIYSTILFGIAVFFYLTMEISRIGFAPILNLISQNLTLVQKVKNAK